MPTDDLHSAARRAAADIREGSRPAPDDLLVLLPALDAAVRRLAGLPSGVE